MTELLFVDATSGAARAGRKRMALKQYKSSGFKLPVWEKRNKIPLSKFHGGRAKRYPPLETWGSSE